MKQIKFRLTAFSDAAGKYNPDAVRSGNEDDWYVDDDLGDDIARNWSSDKEVMLSDCGMLMVVADGMGGMNAGEIASEIAVKTVEDYFSPGKITPSMAATYTSRRKYMEKVITEADERIKQDAAAHTEHEGMGSTIIMAWLAGDEVTISWCGDSRAYRFNPDNGIEMLSEDHSYVQDLVRAGALSYEDTFGHPNGNIITRSLGDPEKKAQPETRNFKVYRSDIILLCSDGLSGVLFDQEVRRNTGELLSSENLEDIIRANRTTMQGCREALMQAAERNDWYDNVTVILCEILDGTEKIPVKTTVSSQGKDAGEIGCSGNTATEEASKHCCKGWWTVITLVLMSLCFGSGLWYGGCQSEPTGKDNRASIDSIDFQNCDSLRNLQECIDSLKVKLKEQDDIIVSQRQELKKCVPKNKDNKEKINDSKWVKTTIENLQQKKKDLEEELEKLKKENENLKEELKKLKKGQAADSLNNKLTPIKQTGN